MLRNHAPLLLAAALLAAGCTPTNSRPAAAPSATRPNHAGQSLWHLIDENGKTLTQLPDDDATVTAVRRTVVLHSGVVDNRDHRSITGSASQEFTFYSKGFADKLRSQRYDTKLSELFTSNRLVTRQTSIAWYRSTFPQDMTTAKVEMDSVIEFTSADQSYLKTNKFELNKPYTQHRTVSLTKTDGKWTIVGIEKDRLTQEAATIPKPTP
ncbi:hypothetical protein ACFY8P_32500 [Streptomyces sp. NPDC012693]|jgi:hypothetical protein|uniref:hypothetical protein n=1 Tax=unclassified Streptomyces TaxID=2593676 RepID=UPI002030CDA4|nr:hypothetical protein [Streptomyces sp. MSC1_001]